MMIDLSMDLVIGLWWLLAFSVIVLFLGALNYFIGKSHSDIKIIESHQTLQQSNRSHNRKKQARRQRQVAAAAAAAAKASENLNNDDEEQQETKSVTLEKNIEQEEEEEPPAPQPKTDENDEEFEDPMVSEDTTASVQQQIVSVKQKNKNKTNRSNNNKSINNEAISSSKPQASVAPVKQSISNSESNQNSNPYSYSDFNSLPPRFQQQQQQQQKKFHYEQKSRKKKSPKSSDSSTRQTDFSSLKQQLDLPLQTSNQNSYSSESDNLTESSSTAAPHSTESQFSPSKRPDLIPSLSSTNRSVDDFLSILDKNSFSIDELNLLLNQITNKYSNNKQDRQRSTKTDKTLERILDETYRSQAKILAIELQTEKNRVLELSKVNNELDHTIRQLQQPNNNMAPYQQTILHYQMQIRRLTNENSHLVHQLHAYSVMPTTINELKHQQAILNDQLRQLSVRNGNLEQEIADGERASKQAAEIYKKADTQKQERIEQMMTDINKYKKIDRDLNSLRVKHDELEKNLSQKFDNLIHERDHLKMICEQLKEKLHEFNNESISQQDQIVDINQLKDELIEVQNKNDLLKQRNLKILEQLNKFSQEENQ